MKNALAFNLVIGMILGSCYNVDAASRQRRKSTTIPPNPNALRVQGEEFSRAKASLQTRVSKEKHLCEKELLLIFNSMIHNLRGMEGDAIHGEVIKTVLRDCEHALCEDFELSKLDQLVQQILTVAPKNGIRFVESREAADELDLSPSHQTRRQRGSIDGQVIVANAKLNLESVAQELSAFGQKTESSFSQSDLERIETLQEVVDGLTETILGDSALGSHARQDLEGKIQGIKDTLAKKRQSICSESPSVGRMINPTAQVAAKTAVFAITAMLEITGILAVQVQRLALAEKPELVTQRNSYRTWGIRLTMVTIVLAGILITGNAAGIIDVQVVPDVARLLASGAGLLS